MDQDLAVLQNISDTLKLEPSASQRQLAHNASMSLGMMNAILGRFVERGWIMLTNVNARKLAYAVTPVGIAELAERSRQFAKRTFKIASEYNDVLTEAVSNAKAEGKKRVVLYGESYIGFLLEYVCQKLNVEFAKADVNADVESDAFCVAGETEEKEVQSKLASCGVSELSDLLSNIE